MGQAGLVHLAPPRGRAVASTEVEQFEHEPVAAEIGRGHSERFGEAQQLGGEVVGWLDLTPQFEPEQLDVEASRSFEIGHALADVVEHDSPICCGIRAVWHGSILPQAAPDAYLLPRPGRVVWVLCDGSADAQDAATSPPSRSPSMPRTVWCGSTRWPMARRAPATF